MRREEIIAKGAYTAPQFGELVSVKQFIMLRQKGEKYLLLRLCNDRSERVDSVCFRVLQYDVKGNLVGTETVVNKRVCAEGGEDFAPDNKIKLNHACIDFVVEMVSATYGNYTYRLHGGELTATYEERDPAADAPVDKARLARRLHGRSGHVSVKTLSAPKLMVSSMAVILLIVGLFAFLQLKNFMATEEFFTLDSVEYRFATENRESGPIVITGYKGKAGNIIVPTSIEGHAVAGIDDGAFAGKVLHTVTIRGEASIGRGAFADCRHLAKVDMPLVTEIGAEAFRGCSALGSVTLHKDITAIHASTFEGCRSFTEIQLPEGLTTLGDKAFKDCVQLTAVTVPATVNTLGANAFENCRALGSLTIPFVGETREGSTTLGYLFGGTLQVPSSLKTVIVTNTDVIADEAFAGCADIRSIILPSTVYSIGSMAFADCRSLTEMPLPEALASLGEQAFLNCVGLTDVTIPAGVRKIRTGCFSGCSGIKTLTLPAELIRIEEAAFRGCSKLQKLEIPASVTAMEAAILEGCSGLEELVLPFIGEHIGAETALTTLFNGASTKLRTLTVLNATKVVDSAFEGFSGLTSVSLNRGIESIGQNAFKDCTSLQTLLIPSSVGEIGARAFENCSALKLLDLPAGLTVIPEGLFAGCLALEGVEVPDSVKAVESYAFAGCASLKDATWLAQMESMGGYVFQSCLSLKNVSLPSSLTRIENGTFMGCEALTVVSSPASVTAIGEQAFKGCSSLKNFTIPGKTEVIEQEAFAGCASLAKIQLPATLRGLGESAFADCTSIQYIVVPTSVTAIGRNLLDGCYALESLTVPFIGPEVNQAEPLSYLTSSDVTRKLDSVYVTAAQAIADDAFYACDAIETIQLNEGITSIGANAFRECAALTALVIPDTVSDIGENAFRACRSLTEIILPDGVITLQSGIFSECGRLTKISVPFIGESRENATELAYFFDGGIPAALTEVALTDSTKVADYAFQGCSSLETITLAGDLTYIGQYALSNCSSLTEIELPESLETLGAWCFYSCDALESVTVPSGVTQIGQNAFAYCHNLAELSIPFVGGNADDGNTLTYLFDGIWNVPQTLTKVTVSASMTVKDYAFNEMRYLEEIVYEQEIGSIGNYAFSGCYALQTFEIPATTFSIGNYAFSDCDAFVNVEIPEGVETLGSWCFYSCDALESVTVPSGVTQIGQNAFAYCHNLAELSIPFVGGNADDGNTLTYLFDGIWNVPQTLTKVTVSASMTVKDFAFNEMRYLEEIVYEQEIESIGNYAFSGCYALQTFEIPVTTVSIGDYAFSNCEALVNVEIPEGVETLGSWCFYSCDALESLVVPASVTQIGYAALDGCNNLAELTIPFVGGSADDGNTMTDLFDGYWYVPQTLKKVTVTNSTVVKDSAFSDMRYLEEIVYEQDIESIGSYAFSGCSALSEFEIPSTVLSIGYYAFYNCDALTEMEIPEGVETLGERCFYSCDRLESVVVPTSVTEIGYAALANCSNLAELTIPFVGGTADDGNTVSYLFDGTWNAPQTLKKITVTNSTVVKDYAFSEMRYLEEIVYEQDIESIGYDAFSYCRAMKRFTIPETCQWVADRAFFACYALYEVYNESALTFDVWDSTDLLSYALVYRTDDTAVEKTTSNGVEFLLGDDGTWYAIDYKGEDEAITFPASFMGANTEVTEYKIAQYAFWARQDIRCVTIPESVLSIGWDAFYNCTNLLEVYNLSSLSLAKGSSENGYVAYYAYRIHEDASEERLTEVKLDGFTFLKSDDHWFLTGYTGSESEVVLGSFTYEGQTVSSYEVVMNAFNGNSSITSLVITDAVKAIGEHAFSSMHNLKTVSFADNHSVTYLEPYAFAYCSNLFRVVLPTSLTDISYGVFSNCYGLAEIYNLSSLELTLGSDSYGEVAKNAFIIHDSLDDPELVEVTIGDYVFWNTGDIWALKNYNGQEKHIVLGAFTYNGQTIDAYSICAAAFRYNSNIESIVIGNEVKQISEQAFYDCSRLCRVSFADNTSLTKIPEHAFAYCRSLDQVILPASLLEIEYDAFWECTQLIEVYNLSSLELTIGDSTHGCVAYYAQVIHTSLNEVGLNVVSVERNGYIYKFKQEDGAWVLYTVTSYPYYGRYDLPELIVDGVVTEYRVSDSVYLTNYNTYVIPASVTYLNLAQLSNGWIYYMGTPEELAALADGFDLSGFSVYYYADCVHKSNQWSYDQYGNMITGMNCSFTYVKNSTCQEKGVIEYTCYYCGETWQEEDDALAAHIFNEENVCEICHAVFQSRPLEEMWSLSNDATYPFEITEEGVIRSTNKAHGSRATLTLVATQDMLFTFRYFSETERGCDYLVISRNGEEILRTSGDFAEWEQADTFAIEAGDTITIAYVKDGSVSVGADGVMLSNIVYLAT